MSTSVSPASVPDLSALSPPRQSRAVRFWVAAAVSVLLMIVGFIVVKTQGFVSGSEFSPTHFQQRDFSFYEIPLFHLQITPIRRSGTTPITATYVRQNALIPPATGAPQLWHLVSLSRGFSGETPADAKFLADQLSMTRGSDPYWRKWSVDHPKAAAVLWPVIARLARRELYVLIPRLMEIAQPATAPDELQRSIDQYLTKQYADLIADLNEAGRSDVAGGLLDEALQDYPDNAKLQSLR